MIMNYKEETEIYHIICKISKICRDYFYGRKYLPSDFWRPEGEINELIDKCSELKKVYKSSKKEKTLREE